MIDQIKEYLQDKKIRIDDLLEALDNAHTTDHMLAIAYQIKSRRKAAEEMFNDLYIMLYDNKRTRTAQTDAPDQKKGV